MNGMTTWWNGWKAGRLLLLAACLVALALARPSHADRTQLADGSIREDRLATRIGVGGETPLSMLAVPISNGVPVGRQAPVNYGEYIAWEFRPIGDMGDPNPGRVAHITAPDGRRLFHVVLQELRRTNTGWMFIARNHDEPPGGETFTLTDQQVASIVLEIPNPNLRNDLVTMDPISRRRSGELQLFEPPDGTTLPEAGKAPPPTVASGPDEPMTDEEAFDQIVGVSAVYGNANPLKEPEKEGLLDFDITKARSGADIVAMGMTIMMLGLGGLMLITFVVGTFVVLFTCRNEGISDITVPRAIATSALLAFVPPGLFAICVLIPIPIFCSVKMIAGLFAWWISARIIVAGMLEVMEGKATDILVSFYAVLIFLVMMIWIYFKYFYHG